MRETYKESNKVRDKLMIGLAVYNVGNQQCDPLYQWGPGIRDHFLLHYVTGGKGAYRTGSQEYAVKRGDLFLVYPDTEVSYQADHSEPWSYAWVGFSGSDASSLLAAAGFRRDRPMRCLLDHEEEVTARLARINEAYGNDLAHMACMTGELYRFLSMLITFREAARPREHSSSEEEIVRTLSAFIDSRYSYPVTVRDMAEYVNVSRSFLYRIFKKQLNISPKEYLDQYRIRRARLLLRETQLPIGVIAMSVGYEDALYFSKVFHKMSGQTPSAYRREHSRQD